jgi:outer membrane protein
MNFRFLCALCFVSLARAETITLDQAIQSALAKNFSIRVETFSPEIQDALLSQAYGIFDPSLQISTLQSNNDAPQGVSSLGARLSDRLERETNEQASIGGLLPWGLSYTVSASGDKVNNPDSFFFNDVTSFAGISLKEPLLRNFGLGPTLVQIHIARDNRDISVWAYRQSVIDAITDTIFAYNELYYANEALRIDVSSHAAAAALVDENEKRFKDGSMSQNDVDQARAKVAGREEAILIDRHNVETAKNRLKQLIYDSGRALLKSELEIEPPPPSASENVNTDSDLATAFSLRPDYQEAHLNVEENNLNARYARNQLLPEIDLVANYGFNGQGDTFSASRSDLLNHHQPNYGAGLQVTIPLTFIQGRAQVRATRLQLRQAEMSLKSLEQDIVVEVGDAAEQVDTTLQRVETTRAAAKLAQKVLDGEVEKLRAGTSTTFVVLSLQETLQSVELRAVRSVAEHNEAIAEYDRQLGRTLVRHGVELGP